MRRESPRWTDVEFYRTARTCTGNPRYLRELIRAPEKDEMPPTGAAVEQVAAVWPASLARHVLRRVAAIGPDAIALANAMAVLWDGSALAHATQIAQLPTLSYPVGDLAACETQARTHLGPLRADMGWEGIAYTIAMLLKALPGEAIWMRPSGCSPTRPPSRRHRHRVGAALRAGPADRGRR